MATSTTAAPQEKIKELQQQMVAKRDEARALVAPYEGKGIPEDVLTQLKGITGQVDNIKATIEAHKQLNNIDQVLESPTTTPVSWREAVADEGNELPVDTKSWRTYEVKNFAGVAQEYRYSVPLAVSANVKGITGKGGKPLTDKQYERAYSDGFELYCRKGLPHVREYYPIEAKALSEGTDTAGGFTVPVDFKAELIKKQATYSMVRPNADVIQTNRDVVIFPRVNYTTASDDSTGDKFTSPVRMSWSGETPATSTTVRVTDQVLGQYEIKINTAMASQLLSNDLIEDSAFDISGYASSNLAEAFALGEDYAFINGSGIAQPIGILTQVDTGGPASMKSGTNADIQTSGDAHAGYRMVKLFYTLAAQYRRNAVWMMNSQTMLQVESLVDGNKRPLVSSLITGANIGIGMPDMIKGRPVLIDEFTPDYSTTNNLPIIFGDWKGYTIADRVSFSIQRNDQLYMETNFTLLLARKRVGGLCIKPWMFKVMKAAA